MHTEQKVWSSWSLRQQNYLNYPTFTEYFVKTKICQSSCGASFLWGPLFGRTCWTCLNPPLNLSRARHIGPLSSWKSNTYQAMLQVIGSSSCISNTSAQGSTKIKVHITKFQYRYLERPYGFADKKASIRWQDSARRQFQAGLKGDLGL